MNTKVIGIGNRIMMDDAIGIRVLEELEEELKGLSLECIIGETDIEFTLNAINNGDFIIIIDSSYFGNKPGTVLSMELNQLKRFNEKVYSLHQLSLVKIINNFKHLNITGKLITIEAGKIDFGLELSEEISMQLELIKEKVLIEVKKGIEFA